MRVEASGDPEVDERIAQALARRAAAQQFVEDMTSDAGYSGDQVRRFLLADIALSLGDLVAMEQARAASQANGLAEIMTKMQAGLSMIQGQPELGAAGSRA
jgi:hypothetical protein